MNGMPSNVGCKDRSRRSLERLQTRDFQQRPANERLREWNFVRVHRIGTSLLKGCLRNGSEELDARLFARQHRLSGR